MSESSSYSGMQQESKKIKKRIGICPGTFDPITVGHHDIIKRALTLVDELIVAVSGSTLKNTLFSVDKRLAMVTEDCQMILDSVDTDTKIFPKIFDGLLVNFAKKCNANIIIRGLRAVSDFEMEFQMASTNSRLANDVDTVFLMSSEHCQFVSSRMVKEVASLGGDVSTFVSPKTKDCLLKKLNL